MCVSGCVHDGLTKHVPVCMRQTGEQTLNHKVKDKYHWTKHTQTSVEMFAGVWVNKKEKNKKKDRYYKYSSKRNKASFLPLACFHQQK